MKCSIPDPGSPYLLTVKSQLKAGKFGQLQIKYIQYTTHKNKPDDKSSFNFVN